ncbi:hypothetical protein M231_07553 [Tremella mesenterica]|uniref:Exportin-T n=1 Tax=Tremella mesenterica TaxID=5217 RepID=A0A4Q1B930_TREME|nr:hypothetical protein M231_07553 [Tremella mesenterica]
MSTHLTDIPQAVRIAASHDPSLDSVLKQQAIEYLAKVKDVCEETWQDCLSLYLQGAGAPGPSQLGKDGKQKLETDLRIFCEQVVETALLTKLQVMTPSSQQAIHNALVEFVQVEWVNGPCEGGQSFFRNKLALTLAYLFLASYPSPIPQFLHTFLQHLSIDPSPSKTSLHPQLLVIHLLNEIALEVHDTTIRSVRPWSKERTERDGMIRDTIRTSGDERLVIDALLSVAERGLNVIENGQQSGTRWQETVELTLKTVAAWTPWVDISVSVTPKSLQFFQRSIHSSVGPVRIAAANILRTLVCKGMKSPADKLQVLKILDPLPLIDRLELATRSIEGDEETVSFRAALGSVISAYGSDLLELTEDSEVPEPFRQEAESMIKTTLPLILRFLSDRQHEVPLSVSLFITEYLKVAKKTYVPKILPPPQKGTMPPPPPPMPPLPQDKRDFLASLLSILVRQLAWPDDAEWESPGSDTDPDDDLSSFRYLRVMCRSFIESIAAIDRTMHTEVVANIAVTTLESIRTNGTSSAKWQDAELALHLVYTFGEMTKVNTRAAFYELPPEIASNFVRSTRKDSFSNRTDAMSMSSGSNTPAQQANGSTTDLSKINGSQFPRERIDYSQYSLTPLGQLLTLCMTSGISAFPHPSVSLQYFEIGVRYAEFWKSKPEAVPPLFEAMLGERGVHNQDEGVRRRCFYLFSRFVKECRGDLDMEMVPPVLQGMHDLLVIKAELPEREAPEDDILVKATTGKSYFTDQMYLFEATGMLVYHTRSDATRQIPLLEAIAGPLMGGIGSGLQAFGVNPQDELAVLSVHHHLMALGNFAKGFPPAPDRDLDTLPYQPPFKQMTEALLQALAAMKTQQIVRDSARFAFSQFVTAIGQAVAELVPQFVSHVVTEFQPAELVDFMTFLGLLMHRLKKNTFETMDMLLLPLLSRIFAVLGKAPTGTDEALTHRKLKEAFLAFITSLMNANLDGVFITSRNKPEFENVLQSLLSMTSDFGDQQGQRLAFSFFAKSVIAWGTSPEAVSSPTQALPGYENFIYQSLLPICFQVPADNKFNHKSGQPVSVLHEIAMLLRNVLQARGQEGVQFLLNDLLPGINCPPQIANQLVEKLRTEQSKDFRKTFADFIKAMKS